MQVASLPEIRKELKTLTPEELVELINRMARFKKENKELLSYLLFDTHNETGYIERVKDEINSQFQTINRRNLYWARKGIRRILKLTNKYIRYSSAKSTEIELRAEFCKALQNSGIPVGRSAALQNLHNRELERIDKAIESLHEDQRMDFEQMLAKLSL